MAAKANTNGGDAAHRSGTSWTAGFSFIYLRNVSCHQRDACGFEHWSEPDASCESQHYCRRDTAQYARKPGSMDYKLAGAQARKQDAAKQLIERRPDGAAGLFTEFEVTRKFRELPAPLKTSPGRNRLQEPRRLC